MNRTKLLSFFVVTSFLRGSTAGAQWARSAAEQKELIERAKQEGEVSWYASMGIDDAQALQKGFEKKYPFLKTNLFRSGREKVLQSPLPGT